MMPEPTTVAKSRELPTASAVNSRGCGHRGEDELRLRRDFGRDAAVG
jgi:hypothetical protein